MLSQRYSYHFFLACVCSLPSLSLLVAGFNVFISAPLSSLIIESFALLLCTQFYPTKCKHTRSGSKRKSRQCETAKP